MLTYQITVQIDDLKRRVTAGNIGKLPDSLLMLISDAHRLEVDFCQCYAGCYAWTQTAQPLPA